MSRKEQLEAFGQLLDIMDELREKCPWDKKQTFESLRIQTIKKSTPVPLQSTAKPFSKIVTT